MTQQNDPLASVGPGNARRQIVTVVLLVLAVSVLHYGTVTSMPLLHDVYRRLYYIPVGLAAVWFGVRGGLVTSAAGGGALRPAHHAPLAARRARNREPVHGDRPVLRVLRADRPLRRAGAPLPPAQRGDRGEARGLLPGTAAAGRHDPGDRGADAPRRPARRRGRTRRDDHARDPQPALVDQGDRRDSQGGLPGGLPEGGVLRDPAQGDRPAEQGRRGVPRPCALEGGGGGRRRFSTSGIWSGRRPPWSASRRRSRACG